MKSGFVAVVGRPNVGKSTLVNACVGEKVSIVSSKPNTTRFSVRGIAHLDDAQIVFVDTPGIHKPRSVLSGRLNDTAYAAFDDSDVDVLLVCIDAAAKLGPGDRNVLRHGVQMSCQGQTPLIVVVNKVDRAKGEGVLERLLEASAFVDETLVHLRAQRSKLSTDELRVEYFPVSAKSKKGVLQLCDSIVGFLPTGPEYFPATMASDVGEHIRVAELVREELLARLQDELPHAVACQVSEWEGPYLKVEILVARDSQKGIVIGHDGSVLKAVGIAVRPQIGDGIFLELHVKVEKNWQERNDALDRLGY